MEALKISLLQSQLLDEPLKDLRDIHPSQEGGSGMKNSSWWGLWSPHGDPIPTAVKSDLGKWECQRVRRIHQKTFGREAKRSEKKRTAPISNWNTVVCSHCSVDHCTMCLVYWKPFSATVFLSTLSF